MAVLIKPHTGTIYAPFADVDALNVELGAIQIGGQSVRGQLTPTTSAATFERWGVQLRQPHEWFCDPGDEELFEVNGLFVVSNVRYKVMAPPMVYSGIGAADHALVLLEREQ